MNKPPFISASMNFGRQQQPVFISTGATNTTGNLNNRNTLVKTRSNKGQVCNTEERK